MDRNMMLLAGVAIALIVIWYCKTHPVKPMVATMAAQAEKYTEKMADAMAKVMPDEVTKMPGNFLSVPQSKQYDQPQSSLIKSLQDRVTARPIVPVVNAPRRNASLDWRQDPVVDLSRASLLPAPLSTIG